MTFSYGPLHIPVSTNQQGFKFCADTGCSLEDLPGVRDDKDRWWERESRNSVLSIWLDADDNIYSFRMYSENESILTISWLKVLQTFFYAILSKFCSQVPFSMFWATAFYLSQVLFPNPLDITLCFMYAKEKIRQ